jgi:hypothetical protein
MTARTKKVLFLISLLVVLPIVVPPLYRSFEDTYGREFASLVLGFPILVGILVLFFRGVRGIVRRRRKVT